jgi:site-specific DNA recombinase
VIQKAGPTVVRCAVYTRKSTDEGLDSDFNSLDAQREAAESYVASQKAEGWVCLPEHYDDGGFSGATTQRPALQRLLADMDAGAFDVLVVYRTDRLSRSILDFLRLLERTEKAGVAYVSVTESFSTGTPAGRLMMHLLLSFAQYEREVISERTRDKVHAARRRGRFTGSTPPMGYDLPPEGRRLVVNESEAERVREIFDLYLRRGSLIPTVAELNRRGWRTKRWVSRKGTVVGDTPFVKTSLHGLLTNATVAGLVRFGGELYPGEHEAVVDPDLWKRVQERLKANGNGDGRATKRSRCPALLAGLLWCSPCGKPMGHTYTAKGSRRYRYYRCGNSDKTGADTCPSGSLPAAEIERYVVGELAVIGRDEAVIAETVRQARELADAEVRRLEAERAELEKALRALDGQTREVATAAPSGPNALRLADLQAEIATTQARMAEIHKELDEATASHLDEADLRAALADFDALWGEMTPAERTRVLHALVERVAFDGQAETVAITFRPVGIKALSGEPHP